MSKSRLSKQGQVVSM